MRTQDQYQNQVHKIGRISFVIALTWLFMIPIIMCIKYDLFPSLKTYFNASLTLFLVLTPIALSEIISFVPLLGAGASYLAFETGNVSNLKLPCAINALKLADVELGTEEAEVLSTISVAISSIVTTIVIILGVILLVPLSSFFTNEYVIIASNHIIPALFGALFLSFVGGNDSTVKGQWKAAIVPFIIVLVLHYLIYPIKGFEGIVILIMIPITLFSAKILHKKGYIKVSVNEASK